MTRTDKNRSRSAGRHRSLRTTVILVLVLPMVLSPTHPVSVYGYLIDLYDSPFTPKAFASSDAGLEAFLTSPEQVERYRADLLEDAMDTYTGKFFAIVRRPDGTLRQEAVRTWNGLLPRVIPALLRDWLDRKELPFLGDEVDIWLRGDEIIAMGHYHAFGGAPSPGDRAAQYFSDFPEVVVVNGLIPMVYVGGTILAYGENVHVSEDVFRSLRGLQGSLLMEVNRDVAFGKAPTEGLVSFLGYLRDYRNVDISKRDTIAAEIRELCEEFKDDYCAVFTEGFLLVGYDDSPDKWNVVSKLQNVKGWGEVGWMYPAMYDRDCAEQ